MYELHMSDWNTYKLRAKITAVELLCTRFDRLIYTDHCSNHSLDYSLLTYLIHRQFWININSILNIVKKCKQCMTLSWWHCHEIVSITFTFLHLHNKCKKYACMGLLVGDCSSKVRHFLWDLENHGHCTIPSQFRILDLHWLHINKLVHRNIITENDKFPEKKADIFPVTVTRDTRSEIENRFVWPAWQVQQNCPGLVHTQWSELKPGQNGNTHHGYQTMCRDDSTRFQGQGCWLWHRTIWEHQELGRYTRQHTIIRQACRCSLQECIFSHPSSAAHQTNFDHRYGQKCWKCDSRFQTGLLQQFCSMESQLRTLSGCRECRICSLESSQERGSMNILHRSSRNFIGCQSCKESISKSLRSSSEQQSQVNLSTLRIC